MYVYCVHMYIYTHIVSYIANSIGHAPKKLVG